MSRHAQKVIVFELLPFHAHNLCLHSHLLRILSGHNNFDIKYYLHPQLLADNTYFQNSDSVSATVSSALLQPLLKCRLLKPWLITKFRWIVATSKPDIIIFNSLEPGLGMALFKQLRNIPRIALVHNPERIPANNDNNALLLCMNRYIFNHYKSKIDGYCLSFFGPKIDGDKRKDQMLIIGIPGGVSFNRRDYRFLLETARILKNRQDITYDIRFNIIGSILEKDGPSLLELVHKHDLNDYFYFHNTVSDREFVRAISECDALLPLITDDRSPYFVMKNSATFSHSARYAIPMIMTERNAAAWAIPSTACVIYNNHKTLADALITLKRNIPAIKSHYETVIEQSISENKSHLRLLHQSKNLNLDN